MTIEQTLTLARIACLNSNMQKMNAANAVVVAEVLRKEALLKTGALAQYTLERGSRYRTEVVRYVDGGEQRYREWNGVLRRWVVRRQSVRSPTRPKSS